MFSDLNGDIYFCDKGSSRVLACCGNDIMAVSIGCHNEGAAVVFPISVALLSRRNQDLRCSAFRLDAECSVLVLGLFPASELHSLDPQYVQPGVRRLLSATTIVPELGDDQIEDLSASIVRTAFNEPEKQHIFVADYGEATDMIPDKKARFSLFCLCTDLDPDIAVIHNIEDLL